MAEVNRYPSVKFKGKRPEDAGLHKLRRLLEERGWYVYRTHGSVYASGLPDILCWHKSYGFRMIETKTRTGTFTPAQREVFHRISSAGGQVWVIIVDFPVNESQILGQMECLFKAGNWTQYLL